MMHVAIATREGLTALMGIRTMAIIAKGKWHVEDWLSIAVETLGSTYSEALVYHDTTEPEHWVFKLPDAHMTPEAQCQP